MVAQHRWHERIERYTPNNTAGRLLLALPSGSVGVYSLTWSVASLITTEAFWLPLLLGGVSLGAIIFSIMMLWPIYLSLIGTVESPNAYPRVKATSSREDRRDDSLAIVKREYAAGRISETEFEHRIENLLHADAESRVEPGTIRRHTSEGIRERG
jgi:uncharacterized membrane protein